MGTSLFRPFPLGFLALSALAIDLHPGTADAAWIDAVTGQPVRTIPLSNDPNNLGANVHQGDHAVVGAKNLYWDNECGTWRDAATGGEVRTIPLSSDPNYPGANVHYGNHAVVGGKTLFWQPCPPPNQPATVQTAPAVPVLPFGFGIGLGFGHKDRGDDQFRK